MAEPIALDRFIRLITKEPLDVEAVKTWFRCVRDHAPSGTIRTVNVREDDGMRTISMVHRETDQGHTYMIPLTRDLTEKEVTVIVEAMAKIADYDFDVETNETTLMAAEQTGIALDTARHIALCTALAKQNHEDWVRERTDAGWRYGTEFNADDKTHPLLRPWDQIPDRYRKPDLSWPQKLVALLNDQGYAVIPKDDLDRLLTHISL